MDGGVDGAVLLICWGGRGGREEEEYVPKITERVKIGRRLERKGKERKGKGKGKIVDIGWVWITLGKRRFFSNVIYVSK